MSTRSGNQKKDEGNPKDPTTAESRDESKEKIQMLEALRAAAQRDNEALRRQVKQLMDDYNKVMAVLKNQST